ncbi:MAG: outer membrane protein assembly factor BamD [Planctomycetota bacterium]|jgi:outer membrane protein assembly factor BamD
MKMRVLLFILLLASAGCSFFGKDEDESAKNWTVDRLYNEAKGALDSGYYSKAVQYYEFLETRFPFGVYGQQSLLDLAYSYYKTEDFDAAVSACDRFVRLYPQNSHVDYAYYLRGLINFGRGRGLTERFLPLDTSQRDPSGALQAFRDFSELARKYPKSEYIPDAEKRMVYLRNLLAQHEVHVANYYMVRGAYVAAANRARYVVETYPRTPAVPDALVLMAKAYKVLELDDLSGDAMRVLELNYPNHPGLYEVKGILIR